MEMAAAHGLAQRLVEMTGLDRINRNELCEIISEEDTIIKSWSTASSSEEFSKVDFFFLLRKTLMFVLTESPLKEIKKKELLRVITTYFSTYSRLLINYMDLRKPFFDVILEPWKNSCFSWDELFQKKVSFRDQKVQEYFCAEPEEMVMARVHVFLKQGKEDLATCLAKNSFLFHSRIAKHFSKFQNHLNQKKNTLNSNKYLKGSASMDWFLFILQKKKHLSSIINEMKQLTCHEGILLIQKLRQNKKNQSFALALLQILFMQELIRPSKFCCTKKIFCLWCIMHKENKTSVEDILKEIRKMVAMYAPSSAHFYLLVDALWKQFGSSFITVYVELYVRGLTVDINHLEAAKNGEVHDDVTYLECHIASIFAKLSTLFSDFHEGAARECMFSAFSLKPTKERLYILQSLTHSILSTENEVKLKSSSKDNSTTLKECKCVDRCSELCNSTKDYFLEHPILMKGISNVPYSVVKDLVTVLEGVRCIHFQYNLFDWHNNATDLGDYLKDFNLAKSWESDTEYASEGSVKSDIEENSPINSSLYQSTQIDVGSLHLPAKRKSESDDVKEMFSLDVGANIEVTNNKFVNKRMKVQDQNMNEISKHDILNPPRKPVQDFSAPLGMEDAIENVIRMTLDNSRHMSDISLNNALVNTSLNHKNDGTEKLSFSSVGKTISGTQVYPYALTNYGKKSDLNPSFKTTDCPSSVKSIIENAAKYASSFTSKPLSLNQVLSPVVSRESVISPALNIPKKSITMQEQSCKQMAHNKFFPIKAMNVSCYSRSNDILTSTLSNAKNVPVYHQEALNLGSKGSMYEQARNTSNTVTQSSQFLSNQATMQVLHKSISTASDISKTQFLSNTSIATSSSMTSPVNVIQCKESVAAQHAEYPSSSHCISESSSLYRTDSRYQVDKNNRGNTVVKRVEQSIACFHDNNFVHCDRSSVIQHTMQHVRDGRMQSQSNDVEMPNQLSVSLNSNAIEQIRSAPKKDITNLPPFTVNVNDRIISNSSVAVSASLVIPRKPQTQIDLASQSVCSSMASVNNETITIPGILASQSVIVSPWEAQRKSHGELLYKKNTNAINVSTIDKRIYKNRPPFGRQIVFKPEPKICGLKAPNKNSNTQVFKAIASPSHINSAFLTVPSSNQNIPNTSQVWPFVNNSSSQGVSQSTSSQPWYSEPYPKPHSSGNNIASKCNESLNLTVQQNTSSIVKPLQLTKHTDGNPVTLFSKPIHPSNNSVSSTNSVSNSSTMSSVLNSTSIFSSPNSNPHCISNENVLPKDFISSASSSFHHNRINTKMYNSPNNLVKNNSVESASHQTSAMQLTTAVRDKNSFQYTTPSVVGTNLHYSHLSSKGFSSCCSPSEVNPCQNCSLPAESNLVQSSSEKNSNRHPEQMIPGDKMITDHDDGIDLTAAAPCDSKFSNKSSADGHGHFNSSINATITNCQYCSNPFLATELEIHILKSHSKELGVKSSAFVAEINSDIMTPENLCTKTSPLVSEQDSLFQKESFHSDLPHAKTFVNSAGNQQNVAAEDDKNLDEIEAHAFNACMDLINSDKDLKRIVQGIDSFHQMDNNYLPFIPSNDSSNNFLTSNLCGEIQEPFVSEAPIQSSALNAQSGEFNNFAECPQSELPEKVELGKSLNCVFEFTEREFDSSKPVQKLIHSKLQSSYSERLSAHTSKTSNELTFSALAEMIKVTITGEGLESVEAPIKDGQKDISRTAGNPQRVDCEWTCPLCSKKLKSARSLKRHIKLHTNLPVIDNSERIASPKLTNISSINMPDSTIRFENDIASKSGNSINDSNDSLNHILQSDVKPNLEISSTSEMYSVLPKGRIKGIVKSPTSQCKFCGKVLTSVYMKKHILKQHQEITIKAENSSSDVNMDINLSSPSQVDSANIPILSPLLEQDIDSSTCLSMSDALKRNNPYIAADTSNFSESSDKLAESTDIKFNFNVLEFSKDTKIESPLAENASSMLVQPPPENFSKFEEKKIKLNIPYNDKFKFVHKQPCHLCHKAFTSVSGLNRHLKCIHNFIVPKSSRKNRAANNSVVVGNNMKSIEEMPQLQSDVFIKVSDSNVENITSKNETVIEFSRASPSENISASYVTVGLEQKARERYKNTSPNMNRSLLRAVLKSNFVSKQRELKDWSECKGDISYKTDSPLHNVKINSCDTYESEDGQYKAHSSANNCSHVSNNYVCLKGGTLDLELKSNNKVCASVPFDSLPKAHLTESSKVYSYALLPDTNVCNHSSASSKFESSHLNKALHRTDEDVQTKYTTHTDSQNLSIQSNEISPISEIISNVSKCHFGGKSNNDNKKEFFEDNSLKLLIPENQEESLNSKNDESIHQSSIQRLMENQELLLGKEENCVNISDEPDVSFKKLSCLTVNDPISSEGEILGNELCDVGSTRHDSDENYTKCRLCHENLSSMDFLSKHLKEVHNIPVLKKHISNPSSPELPTCLQEPDKLSPPKLKLGTNESDSESVPEFDNPLSWSKNTTYSSEQDTSKNGIFFEDDLCILLPPLSKQADQDEETILQNSQPKLKKSFVQQDLAEKEVELGQSDSLTFQPSNHLNSEQPTSSIHKSKIRRHSLCNIYSIFNEDLNPLIQNNLFFNFKSSSFNNKQKSVSLPNLKFELYYQAPNRNITHCANHVLGENKQIEHSAGENTTFSSVTDVTEICKSSYDSSLSQNFPVRWNKIRRRIILPKSKSFIRERRIKRTNRGKCFRYHKKFKIKKTFKHMTLKEDAEISDFLKNHKQPTVTLIRLKPSDESNSLLNQKNSFVPDIIGNKFNMKEAVVKLERMHITRDVAKVDCINEKFPVPNLLPHDTHINSVTMQSHENQSVCPDEFYLDSSNADISHSEVSMTHEDTPKESIELSISSTLDSNTASSNSVQFIRTVAKEEKCSSKIDDELCSLSSIKQCCVVLNRISM